MSEHFDQKSIVSLQDHTLADHIDSLLAQLHFIIASGLFKNNVTHTSVLTPWEPDLPLGECGTPMLFYPIQD